MAANSAVLSDEPHVPLSRISSIRASAAAGNSSPECCPVTATPSGRPLAAATTIPAASTPGSYPDRATVRGRRRPGIPPLAAAGPPTTSAVLGVPLLVALLNRLKCVLRGLPGRVGAQPVLARADAVVVLHRVVLQTEPPVLVAVHGY